MDSRCNMDMHTDPFFDEFPGDPSEFEIATDDLLKPWGNLAASLRTVIKNLEQIELPALPPDYMERLYSKTSTTSAIAGIKII